MGGEGCVWEAGIQSYQRNNICIPEIYIKTEFNIEVFLFVLQRNKPFYLNIGGRNQLIGSLLGSKESVSFNKKFLVKPEYCRFLLRLDKMAGILKESYRDAPYPFLGKLLIEI